MTNMADVVIVGAGSTGAATAWQLMAMGAGRVELVEERSAAAGTTGRSCAIVRMHYTHELLTRMALHSRRVFETFDQQTGAPVTFRRIGWLSLAREDDVEPLTANVQMHQAVGVDAKLLTADDAAELVPGMHVENVGLAAWEPDSGYVDPSSSTAGFVAAAERLGARYRPGVRVDRLTPDGADHWSLQTSDGPITAGAIVVAAGFRTVELIRPLGVELPVTPIRHTVAVVRRSTKFGPEHPIISDRVVGSYYRPDVDGQTLVGATAPYEGYPDPDIEQDRAPHDDDLIRLAERFADRFPSERNPNIQRGYTSTYDCSPDLQPLLGPINATNVHVAVGFTGHGFKIAPAIGQMLAEKVLTGSSTLVDIDLFRPSRFDEGAEFVAPFAYSVPTLG